MAMFALHPLRCPQSVLQVAELILGKEITEEAAPASTTGSPLSIKRWRCPRAALGETALPGKRLTHKMSAQRLREHPGVKKQSHKALGSLEHSSSHWDCPNPSTGAKLPQSSEQCPLHRLSLSYPPTHPQGKVPTCGVQPHSDLLTDHGAEPQGAGHQCPALSAP